MLETGLCLSAEESIFFFQTSKHSDSPGLVFSIRRGTCFCFECHPEKSIDFFKSKIHSFI